MNHPAETNIERGVRWSGALPLRHFDAHTHAYLFHPDHPAWIDPFIGVDVFNMPQSFFLPHPHGGMSAITYLLPESPGGVRNRDSLGDDSHIAPGDLHWTQAGAGIVHEETPATRGQAAIGLQIFVNMPRSRKQQPAAVFKTAAAEMPVVQLAGASVRVVAGTLLGQTAPLSAENPLWATPVHIWDVSLEPDANLALPLPASHQASVLILEGSLIHTASRQELPAPAAMMFDDASSLGDTPTHLRLQAGPQGARATVLAGQPLREPMVPWGPFVGNTRADVAAYAQAYQSGAMGQLAASFSR
ncbi:MAG: hypothetical protein RLZZ612_1907 [Pseudomonadota bacterium]|jgi:redox-sensitive bicupin YhaK (pirin superfamily)